MLILKERFFILSLFSIFFLFKENIFEMKEKGFCSL